LATPTKFVDLCERVREILRTDGHTHIHDSHNTCSASTCRGAQVTKIDGAVRRRSSVLLGDERSRRSTAELNWRDTLVGGHGTVIRHWERITPTYTRIVVRLSAPARASARFDLTRQAPSGNRQHRYYTTV